MGVYAESAQSNFKLIRLAEDILNCLGKAVKYFDAGIMNSLLIHGQGYLK
jgi:hypothetical protein